MTLEDLANLGNAIGSLGIVITIGFLALEMRWTRMESKRQQRITLQQSVMDLELALMSNNAHVALNKWEAFSLESNDEMTKDQLREFFNDEELNIIEARLWHALAHLDMLLAKKKNGIVTEEEFHQTGDLMKNLVSPLAIRMFGLERAMLTPVRDFLQK